MLLTYLKISIISDIIYFSMLRLSNIILNEICGYVHMRTPSRRCTHPKAKFMMEVADKVLYTFLIFVYLNK